MILDSLTRLYENLADTDSVPKWGWSSVGVSFGLNLDETGNLINVVDLRHEVKRNKKSVFVPSEKWVPERIKKSSGISSQFLCENSTYLLGIDAKSKPERSLLCFRAAASLHTKILSECSSVTAFAIKGFFEKWNPKTASEASVIQPYMDSIMTANLIFLVNGKFSTEDPQIRDAWLAYKNKQSAKRLQCLVTGDIAPIARLHPNIKGVKNAQPTGASLVSFNLSAFEHRGNVKAQGFNAPISEYVAFAYATALNYLLANKKHTMIIDDVTVVYWTEQDNDIYPDYFDECFNQSNPNDALRDAMSCIKQGVPLYYKGVELNYDIPFYILGLSPNASRISVRFFLQETFGALLKNIIRHTEDMDIICPQFKKNSQIPLWMILNATLPQKSDAKVSPHLAGALIKSILYQSPYPESLYRYVISRIKSEQDDADSNPPHFRVTYERCAILKAYLIRNKKEALTVALNDNETDSAYVLGRIFSVLEYIQYKAEGNLNSSIKDKFFSSACSTPAKVFPILYKLSTHHLHKLEFGQKLFAEKMVSDLISKLNTSPPKLMNLDQQGMFILGYYHQTQDRFKMLEEKKLRKMMEADKNE